MTSTVSAQSATPTPTPTTHPPHDRTAQGSFHTSDGKSGTYVETYTMADAVVTDTVVYTLADTTTTSTETMTITTNTDGTKTVVFSDLDFGATVAFTSTTKYTASLSATTSSVSGATGIGGGAVGIGTFTEVDGTTGVLTSVLARSGSTSITSTDLTSAAGVLTRQVRLEEKAGGGDSVRILNVDAAGALTVKTIIRFGGMHHQHP